MLSKMGIRYDANGNVGRSSISPQRNAAARFKRGQGERASVKKESIL